MTDEHPWSEAISVKSIPEEYQHIQGQRCECGGKYSHKMQSLLHGDDGRPFDMISCECDSCGKDKDFYFDISSFFGKGF